jgi:hypothetical protein
MKIDLKAAYQLAARLEAATDETAAHADALKLRRLLRPPMPMSEIVAKIPGRSDAERARTVRTSRQALHNWKRGLCRPDPETAERISRATGLPVETITGR